MATVREFPESASPQERQAAPSEREQPRTVEEHTTGARRRPRYGQPFFPVTIFGTSMYVLATAIALIFLAITQPAPLQNPADPLNHVQYNPRPEWYFLSLFQLLKFFQGPLEIIGTAVIPGIATVVLLLLPFYDRNWSRRAIRRPIAVGIASVSILAIALLTYMPIEQTAALNNTATAPAVAIAHPKFAEIQSIFVKNCAPCHIGGAYTANLNLGTYQGVMAGGNGAGVGAPQKVVVSGNATGSYLWQVIAWKQKVGATMPFGRPQLPQAEVQTVYNWIQDGAKQ